jgi:hypothetical protein
MSSANFLRCLVVLACCLAAPRLSASQDSEQTSTLVQGVLYRCTLADGSIQFSNIARAGCVVIGTYIPKAKQQPAPYVGTRSPALIEQGIYMNQDGSAVHDPASTVSGTIPPGASAQCRDGSYSYSQHHRGTCSHHGGVARWL